MTLPAALELDVAVIGGGVAGLWLLSRLQAAGRRAMLFESGALGGGQTLASQGIIHGGLKYALDLKLGAASAALADSPARWRACLAGQGDVDLRAAEILAPHHLFWVQRALTSRITGFFGARMLRGRVNALDPADWPVVLRQPEQVGAVYQLDELVLDVPSLLRALSAPHRDRIRQVDAALDLERSGDGISAMRLRRPDGRPVTVKAACYVFAAGAGNAAVLASLGLGAARAQTRPLHMLLMDGMPGPLYAHCFDTGDKPRLTITSHRRAAGSWVWYVGGQLAERGVAMDAGELIRAARAEFAQLLPQLDLSVCRFAGWRVDRAEGATATGAKPEGPVVMRQGNCLVAWPTKLAMTPQLADMLLPMLPPAAPEGPLPDLMDWPAPPPAIPIWERVPWT